MKRIVLLTFLLLIAFSSVTVLAQNATCPDVVQQALNTVDSSCGATGRNQVCYGNVQLTAEPQPDTPPIVFATPGDLVPVTDIHTLTLSPLDAQQDVWGIALMKLQANLPDALPGQNVVFVLFGDVQISSAVSAVTTTNAPPLHPMQAFYVQSGIGDAPCTQAPDSGLLIQSPNSDVKVNLLIDGVDVTLGSTIYVEAQPGGIMTIDVIEGGIEATLGTTTYVPAGMQARFTLDAGLNAIAWASDLQPYDAQALDALPLSLLPDDAITVAPPLPADQVESAQAALASRLPEPISLRGGSINSDGGGFCSIDGDTPTTATFDNQTSRTVDVIWIDYDCHEEFYQQLAPGQSYVQETFATHPWVVRDAKTGALLAGPAVSASGEPITVTVGG